MAPSHQDHGPRHGSVVAAQTTNFNTDLGGHTGHSHQDGPQQQHGPQTSMWPQAVGQTIEKLMVLSGPGHPHGPLASSCPGAAVWITDACLASRGSMDHGGVSPGGPIQETTSHPEHLVAQSRRDGVAGQHAGG